jgi:hypothetical protein
VFTQERQRAVFYLRRVRLEVCVESRNGVRKELQLLGRVLIAEVWPLIERLVEFLEARDCVVRCSVQVADRDPNRFRRSVGGRNVLGELPIRKAKKRGS